MPVCIYLCLQVFPQLYLPVMEEGNKRVLRPYRKYLPTPSWFSFKHKMRLLNSFLINLIRSRWQARQAGKVPERGDILDRILAAIEVRPAVDRELREWSKARVEWVEKWFVPRVVDTPVDTPVKERHRKGGLVKPQTACL